LNSSLNLSAELYVIGAGGHAREIEAYLRDMTRRGWTGTLKGFLDDNLAPGRHGNLEVLGPVSNASLVAGSAYITALGDNAVRCGVVRRIGEISGNAAEAWTLIHPDAWIGENVEIGEGTCIAPAVVITASVRIGRHSILNVRASVSHDCSIGDFVNINPGATVCGWVNIGEGAFIGAGATIKDRVSIGAGAIIGAGAVVISDIPAGATAVGVPARVIKSQS
jgi:sugar O-acyltransferase (sialic acid O-acetyltransferase NeuD family)